MTQADLTVVHAKEPFPSKVTKTIFLAGPTPREVGASSWRTEVIEILRRQGFDGHVFVPEPRGGLWTEDYVDQIEWEEEGLNRADCILFWVPRDLTGDVYGGPAMPGLTTNDEWGFWKDSGKVVWGRPAGAEKVRYQEYYACKLGVPNGVTLETTAQQALTLIGEGALRLEGECQVPLYIWRKPEFQAWYESVKEADNRLDGVRVSWVFRVPPVAFNEGPPPKNIFMYALHVNVHITAEGRNKINEVVLFRPDISSVVLYTAAGEIVLVKEFRSPVRNSRGYVYELPGGSSIKKNTSLKDSAVDEVQEELGLTLTPERLRFIGKRQLGATLSAHTSAVFAAELTPQEMQQLKAQQQAGIAHGVAKDSERTFTTIWTVDKLLASSSVDWSMMGMILTALRG